MDKYKIKEKIYKIRQIADQISNWSTDARSEEEKKIYKLANEVLSLLQSSEVEEKSISDRPPCKNCIAMPGICGTFPYCPEELRQGQPEPADEPTEEYQHAEGCNPNPWANSCRCGLLQRQPKPEPAEKILSAEEENQLNTKPCPYNPSVPCVQYPEINCGCDPCEECENKPAEKPTEKYQHAEGCNPKPRRLEQAQQRIAEAEKERDEYKKRLTYIQDGHNPYDEIKQLRSELSEAQKENEEACNKWVSLELELKKVRIKMDTLIELERAKEKP